MTSSPNNRHAVLYSGGIESHLMLHLLLKQGHEVTPIYVCAGLCWEGQELLIASNLLNSVDSSKLNSVEVLKAPCPTTDDDHWSITGRGIPDYKSLDSEVYLPQRNWTLIETAVRFCKAETIPALSIGLLSNNPFPDSANDFFHKAQQQVDLMPGSQVQLLRPLQHYSKQQLLEKYTDIELELTTSCLQPDQQAHCGDCNKCRERQAAFWAAKREDKTVYRKQYQLSTN